MLCGGRLIRIVSAQSHLNSHGKSVHLWGVLYEYSLMKHDNPFLFPICIDLYLRVAVLMSGLAPIVSVRHPHRLYDPKSILGRLAGNQPDSPTPLEQSIHLQ